MKRLYIIGLFSFALNATAQTVMNLQECLDSAVAYNRKIRNAELDVKAAGEQRKEAFTHYFPNVSANVVAFHTFDKLIKGDGTYPAELAAFGEAFAGLVGQPYSYNEMNKGYSATLSAVQPLYAGGQISTGNKLARVQEDVMMLQRRLTEKDVMQKVTECYWQLANVKYNLQTVEAAETLVDAVYNQVEMYVKSGVTTRNDLLKVAIRRQELKSNRVKLENAQRVMSMLLAQQIGLGNKPIDIVTDVDLSLAAPVAVDAGRAADGRVELAMAGKGVEAQKLQVRMERARLLPTLAVGVMGFTSDIGGMSDNVKNRIDTKMTNGMVFGTLSIPLSDWWGGSHAVKRQKIKLQQAENDYRDARENLRIDIEASWANVVEAYRQIDIARVTIEQTEDNLRIMGAQYKAGASTLTELLDAETLNRQAHDAMLQAKANYQIRWCDYLRKTSE